MPPEGTENASAATSAPSGAPAVPAAGAVPAPAAAPADPVVGGGNGADPAPAAKPEVGKDPLAPKFAALARQERELQQQRSMLKQEQAKVAQFNEKLKLLNDDPLAFLEAVGLPYEKLTKRILTEGGPENETAKELRKTQERLDRIERERAEQAKHDAQERYTQTVEGFRREIDGYVKSNASTFKVLAAEGRDGVELVEEVVRLHHSQTGEILEIDAASKLVEDHLRGRAQKYAELLAPPAAPEPASPAKKPAAASGKTLNQQMTAASGAAPAKPNRPETDDERLERAAANIKFVENPRATALKITQPK